jgi:hypothetical protein
MAIPFVGSSGLFTRLGHIFKCADLALTHVGATVPPHVDTLYGDYTTTDRDLVSSLYPALASYQATPTAFVSALQSLATRTVIRMANDDAPQPDGSLANALRYLIAQMQGSSDTVKASVVGATVTPAGTNTGNAVLAVSTKLRDGRTAENAYAETIQVLVATDAQSGGATAGREVLSILGPAAALGPLNPLWPRGSNARGALTLIDSAASQAGGGQNWLRNSNFEAFTVANTPDFWHVATGTPGSTILKSTAEHHDGASSLQIAGDGAELTALYQEFGVDTTVKATPSDQLAVNLWCKMGAAPTAGVLEVALVDGSGTIIDDAQGTPSSFTVNLVTLGTSWVPRSGFVRTPRVLPASVRLRLRLSTALDSGVNLFVDRLALARPVQPYAQGPYAAGFSGSVPSIVGDQWTIGVTNDRGGGISTSFQTWFDRMLGMRQLGLLLPSSGTPTIAGSLIA